MSTIAQLFTYSQTALASYATGLLPLEDNSARYVVQAVGMAATQAADFNATWAVLQQSTPTINGFSAVLLQSRVTGQKVLAIAGTDPSDPGDWFSDAFIVQYGTALAMPQYMSLESFYAQLVSSGMLGASEQITVTGHSLGGFLTQAFTARHTDVVSAAYTYNAPGFGTIEALLGFLGVTDVAGASARITNVHATDGLSMTAGLGTMLGASQPVRIEVDANPLNNHSVVNLGDALTIYAVYAQLQPSITVAQAATLFVSSGTGGRRLEDALDSLQALFFGPSSNEVSKTPTGNRGVFFDNLSAMTGAQAFTSLAGKITVELATAADLAARAKTDFSAFLSLQTLSPIILKTDTTGQAILKQANETLAQQWEADQALTPEQRDAGWETFTNTYLLDRQALLQYRIVANINDAVANPDGYLTIQGTRPTENNLRFIDIGSGAMLQVYTSRPSPSTAQSQYVIFGSDDANTITGSAQGDRLYGGGGNDTVNSSGGEDYLEGNAGNDSLDGGKGVDSLLGGAGDDTLTGGEGHDLLLGGANNDTYEFTGNVGLDIIRDSNGLGRIVVAGAEALSGGKKLAANVWIADDKKFTYALVEGNLVIRPGEGSGATGILTVQGWQAGKPASWASP